MPQALAALQAADGLCLEQLLLAVEPLIGRCRPVSRVRQQFVFDLAALLAGLRSAVMLDYVPGVKPQQLLGLLQPLACQQLPAFTGCVLCLEGCCYLANLQQLSQQLSSMATDLAHWPLILSFASGQAAAAEAAEELQQQLRSLAAVIQQQLQTQARPEAAGSSAPSSFRWGVLDLGSVCGLPAMPTLNGLLLGYPAVYWVRDLQEAALAGRVLSTVQLRLFRIQGSAEAAGCQVRTILAFTVPDALCGAGLERRVEAVVRGMQDKGGRWWSEVACCCEEVAGPRAISL